MYQTTEKQKRKAKEQMHHFKRYKAQKQKPLLINIVKKVKRKNDILYLKAFALFKFLNKESYNLKNLKVEMGNKQIPFTLKFKKGIPFLKGYRFNFYELKIPLNHIYELDIQNKIILKYHQCKGRILYNLFDYKTGKNRNSKIVFKDNIAIYFRQTVKNTTYLTIRERNCYDTKKGKIKIFFARLFSKVYPKKNIILLYEKECSKYEESASVLYEKLMDKGYDNCYFILNKLHPVIKKLEPKYQKNIIYKDSFKHLISFFKCKTFIGTETLPHALQLRIANKYAIDKIQDPNLTYVFLQHGVMYMISLDCDLRSGFRNTNYKKHRIIVSSELEAKHFIQLGGFKKENLYITGLAKFDKSTLNKNANKIVIMPTWRRWEVNQAKHDFSQTKYYKMLVRIVNSIPKYLRKNVIVLPHPLMIKVMKGSDCKLKKYIPKKTGYDEILKQCKVLITDYSSISYDAFYRGSNVIFYLEEKEECLKQYGGNAKLMLTEDLAFGDSCYHPEELEKIILDNYNKPQRKKYQERYQKIVAFHDNKNTNRIIQKLIEDRVI